MYHNKSSVPFTSEYFIMNEQIKRFKARLAKYKKTTNENTRTVSSELIINMVVIHKRKEMANKQT